MMNYTACERKCEAGPTVDNGKNDSILTLVRETEAISYDLKSYAYRINSFLFGERPVNDDNRKEPECLKDELETVKFNLLETAKKLNDLCVMLGI